MRKALLAIVALMVVATGCRSYTTSEVDVTEPKFKSYCQRIDDMAVGIEPYMMRGKTHYEFNEDLWDEKVLALDIAMIADGGKTYTVRKAEISATDEFENEYAPMSIEEVKHRIEARGQDGMLTDTEMPDEVTVTGEPAQGFVYFDMEPNNATSREFTVYVFADGAKDKEFAITVDPYRMFMNPTEKWSSYYGGVVPCGDFAKAEEKKEMMAPPSEADRMEKAADRAEEAAKKQERIYEKQLEK